MTWPSVAMALWTMQEGEPLPGLRGRLHIGDRAA
jgi:hypothetical protein